MNHMLNVFNKKKDRHSIENTISDRKNEKSLYLKTRQQQQNEIKVNTFNDNNNN